MLQIHAVDDCEIFESWSDTDCLHSRFQYIWAWDNTESMDIFAKRGNQESIDPIFTEGTIRKIDLINLQQFFRVGQKIQKSIIDFEKLNLKSAVFQFGFFNHNRNFLILDNISIIKHHFENFLLASFVQEV